MPTSYLNNLYCWNSNLVFLAKSNIKHHWIIYPLPSPLLTWSGNQEVGNEKWGMRNENLEMRNKKLGNCKMDVEWGWIGPWEMGNGNQMRILVTEVSPSGHSTWWPHFINTCRSNAVGVGWSNAIKAENHKYTSPLSPFQSANLYLTLSHSGFQSSYH